MREGVLLGEGVGSEGREEELEDLEAKAEEEAEALSVAREVEEEEREGLGVPVPLGDTLGDAEVPAEPDGDTVADAVRVPP